MLVKSLAHRRTLSPSGTGVPSWVKRSISCSRGKEAGETEWEPADVEEPPPKVRRKAVSLIWETKQFLDYSRISLAYCSYD